MRMLANHILVAPLSWPEQRQGRILLPDNHDTRQSFTHGIVQATGPGLFLPNGERPPIEVQPGDHILYYSASGKPFIVQGTEMHLIQEREVIAINRSK